MSQVERPVAARVVLHRWAGDTESGLRKMHRSSITGDKGDKYLYFKGSPTRATAELIRWISEKSDAVETVLRRAKIEYLTRDEVQSILEDDSEVLRWRN